MTFEIEGIITPVVTPFSKDDRLDEEGLRRVIRHVIAGGVHGVFVGGSTGEAYALEDSERARVFEVALDEVNGKIPVYAGTSHVTTKGAVHLTKIAKSLGIQAISVVTPYFITPNEDELYDHYRAISLAAGDMPMLLYNNPDRTGITITVRTITKLAELGNVRGIKDSSGDMTYALEIMRNTDPSFCYFCGKDTIIYSTLVSGGKGAVPASSNVAPKLICALYDAVKSQSYDEARALQAKLAPFRLAFSLGSFPVVLKEALNLLGIEVGYTRLPISPLTSARREQLRAILTQLELM